MNLNQITTLVIGVLLIIFNKYLAEKSLELKKKYPGVWASPEPLWATRIVLVVAGVLLMVGSYF